MLAPNGTAPRIERRLLAKRVFDVVMGQRILARRRARAGGVERRAAAAARARRRRGCHPRHPQPVDLDEFSAAGFARRFPPALRAPGIRAPLVMFLGKLTPRKRVDVLVRAFAQTASDRDAWLVIAGNDMGAGGDDAVARSVARPRGAHRLHRPACADRNGSKRWPTRTWWSIRRRTRSSASCRSKRCSPARRSSSPTTRAAEKSSAQIGGGQVVPLGDVDALARAIGGDAGRARPPGVRRRGRRRAGSGRHSATTSCARRSKRCTARWSLAS